MLNKKTNNYNSYMIIFPYLDNVTHTSKCKYKLLINALSMKKLCISI